MIIGDFNDLLNLEDKCDCVDHPQWLYRGLRKVVTDCRISDIYLSGYHFTWSRGRMSDNLVEERLDRVMGNPE